QPQGLDQEPGAPDWRQIGRTLQARGRAAAQRLSGGGHLAIRHAPPDAGLHRAEHPGVATDRRQRRAPRLSGATRSAGLCAIAAGAARALRARGLRWAPTLVTACTALGSRNVRARSCTVKRAHAGPTLCTCRGMTLRPGPEGAE